MIRGDARSLPLQDACVQCCITSPPYFGLRDYGTANQIGLEAMPAAYVAALVAVFKEVRRVLKDDGTVWLNLGDSYVGGGRGGNEGFEARCPGRSPRVKTIEHLTIGPSPVSAGTKPKDLLGIPWQVAFALQADGWYLRSDVIWSKPNPMPESVTDRPTKAHEYLFLLAKSESYFYDADAIREAYRPSSISRLNYSAIPRTGKSAANILKAGDGDKVASGVTRTTAGLLSHEHTENPLGRNKRTVWTIPTMPYAGAHFATMPEALVEPCILAGCPVGGLVLDPFVGSGTVGAVAERLGRRWVGVDLSYQPLAQKRTSQRGLRWEAPVA